MRRFGKTVEHGFKKTLYTLFHLVAKTPRQVAEDEITNVRRILLLRPNFRIGNTLISTPLIAVFRTRFPLARIDYLGADSTVALLAHFPLDRIYSMSRSFILHPWTYLRLLFRLRREKYDLAVQIGNDSFSGMLSMMATGARYKMGSGKWARGICNIVVDTSCSNHAYDDPQYYGQALGTPCRNRPFYIVSSEENDAAQVLLEKIGFAGPHQTHPFIAFFVGGHKNKRWPFQCWKTLADKLVSANNRIRILVLIGPEEMAMMSQMQASPTFAGIPILPPMPLRTFAALLSHARMVVTPDTGPMHLSVAVDAPTIAILQSSMSLRYAPRGELDIALLKPSIDQVYEAISAHPAWAAIRPVS